MFRTTVMISMLSGVWTSAECGVPPTSSDQPASLDAADELQRAYADVVEQLNPSIVCITAYERVAPPAPPVAPTTKHSASRAVQPVFRRLASASGIVINDEGIILTCRHHLVAPGGELVDVVDVETHDFQHFYARVLGSEPTLNLAVLRLEVYPDGPKPAIKAVKLGTHRDMKPGFTAIAVADPFGPLRTFAPGTLSAFPAQECYQADITSTFMQANMTVHPESYGGALAKLDGSVIAILMPPAVPSNESLNQVMPGVTFGLPISTAITVGEALRQKQTHESPWMGFAVLSMNELRSRIDDPQRFSDLKRPLHGIYIDDVFTPSPATAADVRTGDFLLSIDGERITTVADFQRRLYLSGIGRTIALEIFRGGEILKKNLTIEKRTRPPGGRQ